METENGLPAKQRQLEKPMILLATRNCHKTREIREMLGEGVTVTDATEREDLPEIEETGTTFAENARLKAEGISLRVGGIVLADDSGLEVDALGGEPGVYSARYAASAVAEGIVSAPSLDEANTELVLKKMEGVPHAKRTARFRCVLAVASGGKTLALFDGSVEGFLATEVKGKGGFGYDPIFLPLGHTQSFGELPSGIKHDMSHRSRALAQFREWWAKA